MKNPLVWIVILLLIIILLLLGVVLGWFGGSSDPEPTPTASAEPSVTPTEAPGTNVVADFVARPVTTGGQIPSANALTGAVLETVGPGWVTAIHNSDSYDDAGAFNQGVSILYLISPSGDRYELANLDSLGLDSTDLVAWSGGNFELMLVEDGSELNIFDMVTGTIVNSSTICGQRTTVHGFAQGNNWVVRGSCEGEGFDGLYAGDGSLAPSNIVGEGFGNAVIDVGDVQVLTGFEIPPDERFHAYYPDGTDAFLTSPGDCYPIAKGLGATVAAVCYGSSSQPDIYEIPVDGSAAQWVISAAQIETFQAATIGLSEYMGVSGYCADSQYRVVETSSVQSQLGVLAGPDLVATQTAPYLHDNCHAAVGTTSLVSGNGPLWWVNWDNGDTVWLLPGAGADWPLFVVGASETTALAYP